MKRHKILAMMLALSILAAALPALAAEVESLVVQGTCMAFEAGKSLKIMDEVSKKEMTFDLAGAKVGAPPACSTDPKCEKTANCDKDPKKQCCNVVRIAFSREKGSDKATVYKVMNVTKQALK